jgi:DNA-binding SARP family transcriptional activator
MEFVLFGDIGVAGAPITANLERRIVAVLLAKRNHAISQDHLVDTVWGGSPPASANDSLFSKISRLRRVIGADRLVRTAAGYRLIVADDECDVSRFEALANRTLNMQSIEASDEALHIWHDPVFAEFADEPFAFGERMRLEHLRDEVETHRLELLLDRGAGDALGAADALAQRLPLSERAAMGRARALAATGRHAEAVRAMHDFTETLAEETGLSPSANFAALEHRLVVGTSEQRASSAVATHAPLYQTELVGRQDEVDHLIEALSTRRLVSLVGEGGIGKTRVAAELFERCFHAGRRAVWCSLDTLVDPNRSAILRHLNRAVSDNVADRDISDDELLDLFASDGLLFVLDECERVIDPLGDVLDAILRRCDAHVVVTSRVPLRLADEHVVRLNGLATGGPDSLAVTLLRSRLGDLADTIEPRHLTALAELTDGMPLAIELLATRLGDIPADAVLAMLRSRIPVTEHATRGHNRSLRQAIAWSYESLSADARSLFCSLSTFADGFTLDLLRSMHRSGVPGSETLALAELLDQSLVRRNTSDPDRYLMLRPIADAGLLVMADDRSRQAAECQMVGAMVDFLARASAERRGPDEARWVARTDREFANVRNAFYTAVKHGWLDHAAHIVQLLTDEAVFGERGAVERWARLLVEMPALRGQPHEPAVLGIVANSDMLDGNFAAAAAHVGTALALPSSEDNPSWVVPMVGFLLSIVGQYPAPPKHFIAQLRAYTATTGDPIGSITAQFSWAFVDSSLGRPLKSIGLAIECRRLARRHGAPSLRSMAAFTIARVRHDLNPDWSHATMKDALALSELSRCRLMERNVTRAITEWAGTGGESAPEQVAQIVTALAMGETIAGEHRMQNLVAIANPLITIGKLEEAAIIVGGLGRTIWGRTIGVEVARQRLAEICVHTDRDRWLKAGRRMTAGELVAFATSLAAPIG